MKRVVLDTNIVISSALGGALVFVLEKWDKEFRSIPIISGREFLDWLQTNNE